MKIAVKPIAPVVLGVFSHLPVDLLQPFSRSLRATGFGGKFHVFASGYGRDDVRRIVTLADSVTTVDADYSTVAPRLIRGLGRVKQQRGLRRMYPRLFEIAARSCRERNSLERWRNLEYQLQGLQSLRYAHYLRFLMEDATDADVVMISDLRDVIFQADPFGPPVTGLELYAEGAAEVIGAPGFNTRWLESLYGTQFIDAHRGAPVSCCGTVLGTREAMLAYLTEMVTGIVWRRRPMGPHDQGVHNWLLHEGRLPFARLVPNGRGRVITLGTLAAPDIREDGVVVNLDGSVPPVVHQWDRHPGIAARMAAFRERDKPSRAPGTPAETPAIPTGAQA